MMYLTRGFSTEEEALGSLREMMGDGLSEVWLTSDESERAVELMAERWIIRSDDEERGEPSWIVLGEVGDELWTRDLYRALYAAADHGFGEVCDALESADLALWRLRERVGRSSGVELSESQLTAVVRYLGQRLIARARVFSGEPVWLVIDPGAEAWDAALYAAVMYAQAGGEA